MSYTVEKINGVTKEYDGAKFTYLFPTATIIALEEPDSIVITYKAPSSSYQNPVTYAFSDLVPDFGATTVEEYCDYLATNGFFFEKSLTTEPNDYMLSRAIAQIEADYGDTVSIIDKNKTLRIYGKNENLGETEEMVWLQGGIENWATTNSIDIVVSTNVGDTQEIVIEGHTISGGDLTFVTQTITLDGTTNVDLTTPLYRANRMYNNDSTDFAGTITVEDSVSSETHLQAGEDNQSLKAATSISSADYYIITQLIVAVNREHSKSVDFALKIRKYGKVFITVFPISCSSSAGTTTVLLDVPVIVPKNSDVVFFASSSGPHTVVEATMVGYLAIVI